MRKLLAVVVIAALAWGGYWFVGVTAVERGLAAWFEARRADGWTAQYSDLSTLGFPNRFDTTISDLDLADPRSGLAWQAPFVQILALSYKPHHIIMAMPHDMTVATPRERIEVTSDRMRGSVVFEPSTSLTLDHSAFVAENVTLASDAGWTTRLDEARLATRQTVGRAHAHDIGIEVLGLTLGDATRARFDPGGLLAATVRTLKLDAVLGFDAAWDRFALGADRPNLTGLDLSLLHLNWGDIGLRAAGRLEIGSDGIPAGEITVTATNWRALLKLAVAGGLVSDGMSATVEKAMQFLAGLSADPDTLAAPLIFRDGLMTLGPVPLGRAPILRLGG